MTRDERRKVAGLLRGMSGHTAGLSDGEFIDLVEDVVRGGDAPASQDPDAAFLDRLADLIDPTAHERTVADNLALIDRNRELECELAALKAKLGGGGAHRGLVQGPCPGDKRGRGRPRDTGQRPRADARLLQGGRRDSRGPAMNAREVAGRLYGLPAGELNWPELSEAVLGRRATRAEVVGRIAELLERGAGAEREAERLRAMVDAMDLTRARF